MKKTTFIMCFLLAALMFGAITGFAVRTESPSIKGGTDAEIFAQAETEFSFVGSREGSNALESASRDTIGTQLAVQTEGTALCTYEEVVALKDAKRNIYNNMLNSVDFFDAAEGSFVSTFAVSGKNATVNYFTDIPAQKSYELILNESTEFEMAHSDDRIYYRNILTQEAKKGYAISQLNTFPRPSELYSDICVDHGRILEFHLAEQKIYDRVVTQSDGTKGYFYRPDLTNTAIAQQSLFPQALGMAVLNDLDAWDITGIEPYLTRHAIMISGTISDKGYSEKINVVRYQMALDQETGILLLFEGFSEEGELTQEIRTTEINIYRDGANKAIDRRVEEVCESIAASLRQ